MPSCAILHARINVLNIGTKTRAPGVPFALSSARRAPFEASGNRVETKKCVEKVQAACISLRLR